MRGRLTQWRRYIKVDACNVPGKRVGAAEISCTQAPGMIERA